VLTPLAIHHNAPPVDDPEYKRIKAQSDQHWQKRKQFSAQSQEAYNRGDGQAAHEFSEKAKAERESAMQLDQQASTYMYGKLNSSGHQEPGTVDLHGQSVQQAMGILQNEIAKAQANHQSSLQVIVGKGNHSVNHIAHIKPAVEEYCQKSGYRWELEHNEGRIRIYFPEGYAPPHQPQYQQPQGGYQQPQAGPGYQQQPQQDSDGGCLKILMECLKSLLSSNSNNRR
jgi:DNA-nicking Smr family endonuclease